MQQIKDSLMNNEQPGLYVIAWAGYFGTLITPDNISMLAGAASVCVSLTGICLNLLKIRKTNKNNNDEKDS